MSKIAKTAAEYDKMTNGVETADDVLPESLDAVRARQKAIGEGRLSCVWMKGDSEDKMPEAESPAEELVEELDDEIDSIDDIE